MSTPEEEIIKLENIPQIRRTRSLTLSFVTERMRKISQVVLSIIISIIVIYLILTGLLSKDETERSNKIDSAIKLISAVSWNGTMH